MDSWTSIANQPYLGVTAHFIDANWQLRSVVIAMRYVQKSQTSDELYNLILEILNEWILKISDKLISITTDNGRNVKAAVKRFDVIDVSCMGHLLNLCCVDLFKKEATNNEPTKKRRR